MLLLTKTVLKKDVVAMERILVLVYVRVVSLPKLPLQMKIIPDLVR